MFILQSQLLPLLILRVSYSITLAHILCLSFIFRASIWPTMLLCKVYLLPYKKWLACHSLAV